MESEFKWNRMYWMDVHLHPDWLTKCAAPALWQYGWSTFIDEQSMIDTYNVAITHGFFSFFFWPPNFRKTSGIYTRKTRFNFRKLLFFAKKLLPHTHHENLLIFLKICWNCHHPCQWPWNTNKVTIYVFETLLSHDLMTHFNIFGVNMVPNVISPK